MVANAARGCGLRRADDPSVGGGREAAGGLIAADTAGLIGLAVLVVAPKVGLVGLIEVGTVADDEQVLGVMLLGVRREVEAAGDDR